MAKTAAQLDREIAAALIAGDAELEGKFDVGKKIRRQEGAKAGALLGYTTSKKPVYARPRTPAKDTKAKFPGWTPQDHEDAFQLHTEAAAAALVAGDRTLASRLESWAKEHAGRQEAPTEMTKGARVRVRALLRKLMKDERALMGRGDGFNGFNEQQGERAAERALRVVSKSLGSLLGGVKLAARAGYETVEIWNQTGPYNEPEFVIDLATGRVS